MTKNGTCEDAVASPFSLVSLCSGQTPLWKTGHVFKERRHFRDGGVLANTFEMGKFRVSHTRNRNNVTGQMAPSEGKDVTLFLRRSFSSPLFIRANCVLLALLSVRFSSVWKGKKERVKSTGGPSTS